MVTSSPYAFSQTVPSSSDIDIIRQLEQIEQEDFDDSLPPPLFDEESQTQAEEQPNQNPTTAEPSSCIDITSVTIHGHEDIGDPPEGYDRLTGTCASAEDFSKLLSDLNVAYQDAGWLTTRVYLPEQNLKLGNLKIVVIPGRAEGFDYGEDIPPDARITTAFPIEMDDLVNLRDIEHGLDNFNAVKSQEAKFKFFPGEKVGHSIIRITEKRVKPWRVGSSIDNSGIKASGIYKGKIWGEVDNLLNINDVLSINSSTNLDRDAGFEPRFPLEYNDEKYSYSFNGSYSFPYKFWRYNFSASYSKYYIPIDGVNQDYTINGHSREVGLDIQRLLYRNQSSKYYMTSGLSIKRARSYINDTEITSQRRALTIAELGMRGENSIKDHKIKWDIAGKFGLNMLGAQDPVSPLIDHQFYALLMGLNYEKKLFNDEVKFTSKISAQWSPEELPSSEQFSFGGRSNVRGFHEELLYGNTGIYIRNEFSRTLFKNDQLSVQGYLGLDAGLIDFPEIKTWDRRALIGTALGLRGKISEYLNYDISYARSLYEPLEFEKSPDHFYFTVGLKY